MSENLAELNLKTFLMIYRKVTGEDAPDLDTYEISEKMQRTETGDLFVTYEIIEKQTGETTTRKFRQSLDVSRGFVFKAVEEDDASERAVWYSNAKKSGGNQKKA